MEETNCRDCIHWRRVGLGSNVRVCHYLEDTGRLRRCSPDHCAYKERGTAPEGPVPWLLHGEKDEVCLGCGKPVHGAALEVTDIAQLPWRYAFLHPREQCRRSFYRRYRAACQEFFAEDMEELAVTLLGRMEALQ